MSDFRKYLNKYEFETVLPGSGQKLTFKPITTGQMKALLVHENEEDPKMIEVILDELMDDCIIKPKNFNVEDMYINDRFYFLIELRKYTKGTIYQFQHTCPKCSSQSIQKVDLKKLKVSKLPKKLDTVVKLDDNISLDIDFPRRRDQIQAFDIIDSYEGQPTERMKTAELGMLVTALSIKSIITPDGEDNTAKLEDKLYLLENITTEMYQKIADWTTTNFGVDFKTKIKCKSCEFQRTVDIPPENFFF